jgi:hypothetical protein
VFKINTKVYIKLDKGWVTFDYEFDDEPTMSKFLTKATDRYKTSVLIVLKEGVENATKD